MDLISFKLWPQFLAVYHMYGSNKKTLKQKIIYPLQVTNDARTLCQTIPTHFNLWLQIRAWLLLALLCEGVLFKADHMTASNKYVSNNVSNNYINVFCILINISVD